MNDAVFNTLLAVAQMCMGHFQSISTGTNGHGNETVVWTVGFEQCAAVRKAVEAETNRRADAAVSEAHRRDLGRLQNALEALGGKKFTPEPAPPPPKPMGGCGLIYTGDTGFTR